MDYPKQVSSCAGSPLIILKKRDRCQLRLSDMCSIEREQRARNHQITVIGWLGLHRSLFSVCCRVVCYRQNHNAAVMYGKRGFSISVVQNTTE